MNKQATSIRLDSHLYKEVVREAQKAGLSFSAVVHLLLRAFTEGKVEIGVTQYPKGYLEKLEKESEALSRQVRKGKAKIYNSSKELFDDILER